MIQARSAQPHPPSAALPRPSEELLRAREKTAEEGRRNKVPRGRRRRRLTFRSLRRSKEKKRRERKDAFSHA